MPLDSITCMVAAFSAPSSTLASRSRLRQMRRGRLQWTGCSGRDFPSAAGGRAAVGRGAANQMVHPTERYS